MEDEDDKGKNFVTPSSTTPEKKVMTTISTHYFESLTESFSIRIIESMKEEYGLFVWPCSVILAEYIWQNRSRFFGTSVLELGAGTSLPGLVAAKVGSHVTLTDDSSRLEVLDNMRNVCHLNKLQCEVEGLTWGVWEDHVFDLHPKIILGADVLYDAKAFNDLFATVTFLLQNTLGSVFITTYHNRSGHYLIDFFLSKWKLKCIKLLDGFSFMPSSKATDLTGNIQLVEVALQNNHEGVKLMACFFVLKFLQGSLDLILGTPNEHESIINILHAIRISHKASTPYLTLVLNGGST